MSSRLRVGAWVASAAVGIASAALLVAAPAGAAPEGAASAGVAAAANPAGAPGNNGTVKIHEGAGEPAPEPRNEPHVCTFHVHAQHFDAGQVLTYTIQSWEPTGDRSVVLSGTITADATGDGRDPVSGASSLPDGHYRLTVDTGNGTGTQDKHKMFWVTCAAETTPPTSPPPTTCPAGGCPTTTPPPTCPTSECPTTTPPPTCPAGACPTTTSPTTSPTETPTETAPTSAGAVPPTSTPPTAGGLALTGSSTAGIAGLGLALLLAGVALLCTPAARRRMLGS